MNPLRTQISSLHFLHRSLITAYNTKSSQTGSLAFPTLLCSLAADFCNHLPSPQRTPTAPIGLLLLYCTPLGMWEVLTPREGERQARRKKVLGNIPFTNLSLRAPVLPLAPSSELLHHSGLHHLPTYKQKLGVWRFPNWYKTLMSSPATFNSHQILPYLFHLSCLHIFWGCVRGKVEHFKSNCRHCANLYTNTSACAPPKDVVIHSHKAMIPPNKTDHNFFLTPIIQSIFKFPKLFLKKSFLELAVFFNQDPNNVTLIYHNWFCLWDLF